MDNDLDTRLEQALLTPPAHFSERVMQRIALMPLQPMTSTAPPTRASIWLQRLQNLALLTGGVLGMTQVFAFMFGVWLTGN